MTPKEKAKELYDKFTGKMNTILDCSYPYSSVDGVDLCAKELLVIAVDELIEIENRNLQMGIYTDIDYYREVRAEIGAIE